MTQSLRTVFLVSLAVFSMTAAAQNPSAGEGPGTTVIGDQESPMGLYIMPWRNSSSDPGLDKPARLLDEAMLPMDRDVFRRQTEYFQTLQAHRAKQAAGPKS